MYIGRIYEQLIPVRDRYKKSMVRLPKPEIRKYQDAGDENAYEMAIKECIERGILAEYLKKKGSEVINMLKAEYDYEMDIEVQREEAYEEGKGKEVRIRQSLWTDSLNENTVEEKEVLQTAAPLLHQRE